jgi:hypothetical protein
VVKQDHREQFLTSLVQFAFPVIGKLPVAKVDTSVILEVLRPIWFDKTVTAGRVRKRIEAVLDWCTASGYRTGANPAAWAGHLEAILPAKREITKVEHHRALAYVNVPDFMVALASAELTRAPPAERTATPFRHFRQARSCGGSMDRASSARNIPTCKCSSSLEKFRSRWFCVVVHVVGWGRPSSSGRRSVLNRRLRRVSHERILAARRQHRQGASLR